MSTWQDASLHGRYSVRHTFIDYTVPIVNERHGKCYITFFHPCAFYVFVDFDTLTVFPFSERRTRWIEDRREQTVGKSFVSIFNGITVVLCACAQEKHVKKYSKLFGSNTFWNNVSTVHFKYKSTMCVGKKVKSSSTRRTLALFTVLLWQHENKSFFLSKTLECFWYILFYSPFISHFNSCYFN